MNASSLRLVHLHLEPGEEVNPCLHMHTHTCACTHACVHCVCAHVCSLCVYCSSCTHTDALGEYCKGDCTAAILIKME